MRSIRKTPDDKWLSFFLELNPGPRPTNPDPSGIPRVAKKSHQAYENEGAVLVVVINLEILVVTLSITVMDFVGPLALPFMSLFLPNVPTTCLFD